MVLKIPTSVGVSGSETPAKKKDLVIFLNTSQLATLVSKSTFKVLQI